jgi:hypothetical protein
MTFSNDTEPVAIVGGRELHRGDVGGRYDLTPLLDSLTPAYTAAPSMVGREVDIEGDAFTITGSTGHEWTLAPMEFGETIALSASRLRLIGVEDAVEPPQPEEFWTPVEHRDEPSVEDVLRGSA